MQNESKSGLLSLVQSIKEKVTGLKLRTQKDENRRSTALKDLTSLRRKIKKCNFAEDTIEEMTSMGSGAVGGALGS